MHRCFIIAAVSFLAIGNFVSAENSPPCFTQLETQFFQPQRWSKH